jgi:hypothetical protein
MDNDALVGHLATTRQRLLAEIATLSAADFGRRPADGSWCAAEVAEHLVNVERRVGSLLRDLVEGRRQVRSGLLDRLRRLPPRLVALRLLRLPAPKVVRPNSVPEREDVLARLSASRAALLALLEECRGRDVRAFMVTHGALGAHDLHGWAELIGHHEERHRKQIVEIREALARRARA